MTNPPPPPIVPQGFPLWAVYRPHDAADPVRHELVVGWAPQWDADGDTWIYLPVTPMADGGYGEIRRVPENCTVNFTVTPPADEAPAGWTLDDEGRQS